MKDPKQFEYDPDDNRPYKEICAEAPIFSDQEMEQKIIQLSTWYEEQSQKNRDPREPTEKMIQTRIKELGYSQSDWWHVRKKLRKEINGPRPPIGYSSWDEYLSNYWR